MPPRTIWGPSPPDAQLQPVEELRQDKCGQLSLPHFRYKIVLKHHVQMKDTFLHSRSSPLYECSRAVDRLPPNVH